MMTSTLLSSRIGYLIDEINPNEQNITNRMNAVKSLIDSSESNFARKLLDQDIDFNLLSPISLSILCDYNRIRYK